MSLLKERKERFDTIARRKSIFFSLFAIVSSSFFSSLIDAVDDQLGLKRAGTSLLNQIGNEKNDVFRCLSTWVEELKLALASTVGYEHSLKIINTVVA